jgi:hypothetical protein
MTTSKHFWKLYIIKLITKEGKYSPLNVVSYALLWTSK